MKRVRKDVCHVWAHQLQSDARYGRIFFQGDTIYSYGRHFPIARHTKDKSGRHVILFTTQTYSSTTAGHCNETRGAIPPDVPLFHVNNVYAKPTMEDVSSYAARIAELALSASRAKARQLWLIGQLEKLVTEANDFCVAFGFRTRFTMPANTEDMKRVAAEFAAQQTKANAAKERAAKRLAAKERAEKLEKVAAWQAGGDDYCPRVDDYHFLRLSKTGKTVETSAHAIVPIKAVRTVAKLILRKVVSGQEWHSNGEVIMVGDYSLDSIQANGDVYVGCHKFARTEIERFAGVLGVK